MEVDKTKLTELLVAMCHRAMVIGDNIICSDIYNKQCQTYLGERYGKCPPDCPHLEEAAVDSHCKRGEKISPYVGGDSRAIAEAKFDWWLSDQSFDEWFAQRYQQLSFDFSEKSKQLNTNE